MLQCSFTSCSAANSRWLKRKRKNVEKSKRNRGNGASETNTIAIKPPLGWTSATLVAWVGGDGGGAFIHTVCSTIASDSHSLPKKIHYSFLFECFSHFYSYSLLWVFFFCVSFRRSDRQTVGRLYDSRYHLKFLDKIAGKILSHLFSFLGIRTAFM